MARASTIAAASTAADPTERLKECLHGTIGRSQQTGLEDVRALNRVMDDYVDRTGDQNIRLLDAAGDLEGAEAGLDPGSRDLDWHGPVGDILWRSREAVRGLRSWLDETMPLVGCLNEPGHGPSVPLFGDGGIPAFTAVCALSGVNRGNIDGFEPVDAPGEYCILLPPTERPRVGVGDIWHEVFVWDGVPYGGAPREVWEKLEPVREVIRERAPLSLLDLAIRVGEPEAQQAALDAMDFMSRTYGEDRMLQWRDGFLRARIRDEFRAALPALSPGLEDRLHAIRLEDGSDGQTVVAVPEEILGQIGPEGPGPDLSRTLAPLAEVLGVKLAFPSGAREPAGPDGP